MPYLGHIDAHRLRPDPVRDDMITGAVRLISYSAVYSDIYGAVLSGKLFPASAGQPLNDPVLIPSAELICFKESLALKLRIIIAEGEPVQTILTSRNYLLKIIGISPALILRKLPLQHYRDAVRPCAVFIIAVKPDLMS